MTMLAAANDNRGCTARQTLFNSTLAWPRAQWGAADDSAAGDDDGPDYKPRRASMPTRHADHFT